MAEQGVQVTVFDPVTNETIKHDLTECHYIVLVDTENYHVSSIQEYPKSGTVQFTIKRGAEPTA